mmetsp:Transcript_15470/g.41481  ORF Transcript_15470/g.41481 Transcript_15470/m.41481 type:complete len:128 (-) Transcript_15470:524-907(-)
MKPQIVAKVKHTAFHEPAALATFVAVSLRMFVSLSIFQAARLFGDRTTCLRRRMLQSVLRDVVIASERCNRVELRRPLQPPPRKLAAAGSRRVARARFAWVKRLALRPLPRRAPSRPVIRVPRTECS